MPAMSPSLPGFGDGGWWVQDLASSLPARLIPAGARRRPRPLRRARRQDHAIGRRRPWRHRRSTGRKVVWHDWPTTSPAPDLQAELVTADALEWSPPRAFDAILLDAPCSATGTFRRHPEVLYRARPADHRRQRRTAGPAARPRRRHAQARRDLGLCGLLAGAARRAKQIDRRLPRPASRLSRSTRRSPASCPTA